MLLPIRSIDLLVEAVDIGNKPVISHETDIDKLVCVIHVQPMTV